MPSANANHHATPDRRNAAPPRDRPVNYWAPDSIVKVGYMTLRVVKRIPTPGDGKPDQWELESVDGYKTYRFAPYSGLRLLADRRPKRPQQSKARSSVVKATSDRGTGRAAPKPGLGAVQLARPMTQVERLDRLEELLASVAQRLQERERS